MYWKNKLTDSESVVEQNLDLYKNRPIKSVLLKKINEVTVPGTVTTSVRV
jgi:hypothetical protein